MTPEELLALVGRRLRRLRVALLSARWAWVVTAGVLGLVLLARVVPWSGLEPTAAVLAVIVTFAGLGWAATRPVTRLQAARAADDALHSRDAFAAYLEFAGSGGQFTDRVDRRARDLAASVAPDQAVPRPRWPRWRPGLAVAALVVAATMAWLPNPQDERRAQAAAAADARDAAVEELRRAVQEAPEGSQAADRLAALAESLASMSPDDAAAALVAAEAELLEQSGADLQAAMAAASGLDAAVSARPLPGAGSGDAADQLEQAAASLDSLGAADRAALAERLERLAATQTVGAPGVAQALADAAAAVASGAADAGDQLRAAADVQRARTTELAERAAAAAAAGEVAAARRELSAAIDGAAAGRTGAQGQAQAAGQGQGQGSGEGRGQGQGSGEGQGQGQGQGQGSGEGQGQGQGSGQGQGAGQGQGSGGSPSGQVAGGDRGGSGSGRGGSGQPGSGGASPSTSGASPSGAEERTMFAPPRPTGTVDPSGPLQGSGGDLGREVGRGNAPSSSGAARLPLSEAVRQYRDRAITASTGASVPPAQQQLVGGYFARLSSLVAE